MGHDFYLVIEIIIVKDILTKKFTVNITIIQNMEIIAIILIRIMIITIITLISQILGRAIVETMIRRTAIISIHIVGIQTSIQIANFF